MYSLLRDFHEQYDLESIALTTVATRAMSDSSFITNIVDSRVGAPDSLIELILEVAAKHPDRQVMVLTNSDWHVETLIRKRDELDPDISVPFPSLEVFESIGDKSQFHRSEERRVGKEGDTGRGPGGEREGNSNESTEAQST